MRLTFNNEELEILKNLIKDKKELSPILEQIEEIESKKVSTKKKNAMKKATKARSDLSKKKIVSALNMMRLSNEIISVYSVAKEANVSYNTANKYRTLILGL